MAESAFSNTNKVQKALGDLRKLPLLPATAQQAMTLANDDAANLHEFVRLIEKDVTLASSLLKLANSPMFTWGRTIESIAQAVVRLGLRECQNLMMAVSMGKLFDQSAPQTKAVCAILWKHCFLTACLCRRLNQGLRFDYQGEEFTAGLLHDLGRILLAVTMPNDFPDADPLTFSEDAQILERERTHLDTDHCQLGTLYAQQNRLPMTAIAAIRFHHDPKGARDHRGILGLVAAADDMANFLQRGEDPATYDLKGNLGYEEIARGWSAEKVAEFKRLVPTLIAETAQQAAEQTTAAPAAAKKVGPSVMATRKAEPQASFWGGVRSWLGG